MFFRNVLRVRGLIRTLFGGPVLDPPPKCLMPFLFLFICLPRLSSDPTLRSLNSDSQSKRVSLLSTDFHTCKFFSAALSSTQPDSIRPYIRFRRRKGSTERMHNFTNFLSVIVTRVSSNSKVILFRNVIVLDTQLSSFMSILILRISRSNVSIFICELTPGVFCF